MAHGSKAAEVLLNMRQETSYDILLRTTLK